MALTLSLKWLTIVCQKPSNFVYNVPYDIVQVSLACGTNTCVERQTSDLSVSDGNMKYPIGKSIFADKFTIKTLLVIPLQMLTLEV